MNMIVLNMVFDADNCPNFGSIRLDGNGEYLHLLGVDIDKLNTVLTKAICIDTYHADRFPFQSGSIAFADDTQRAFVYNEVSDSWHEWEI